MMLNDKSKKILERTIGLPYEKIINMDVHNEISYVEQKNGKKLNYRKDAMVNFLPIKTMDEVDNKLKVLTKKKGRIK